MQDRLFKLVGHTALMCRIDGSHFGDQGLLQKVRKKYMNFLLLFTFLTAVCLQFLGSKRSWYSCGIDFSSIKYNSQRINPFITCSSLKSRFVCLHFLSSSAICLNFVIIFWGLLFNFRMVCQIKWFHLPQTKFDPRNCSWNSNFTNAIGARRSWRFGKLH